MVRYSKFNNYCPLDHSYHMFPPMGLIIEYTMLCIVLIIMHAEILFLGRAWIWTVRNIIDNANTNAPGSTASGSGSGPTAPSKRREQVRHAQRYVPSP